MYVSFKRPNELERKTQNKCKCEHKSELLWCPAPFTPYFWFVSENTWIILSQPAASLCVTLTTLPSGLVKTHCFKERLHGFLSPTLLKDRSSPDNTSSPGERERDGVLNAALISAFLSCSQGTAGSEKPDVSQLIRFSSLFFLQKILHLLLLFEACAKGHVLFCTLNAQFSLTKILFVA